MIRKAGIADIPAMGRIINDAAEFGLMLHRSPAYLYEHLRDFHVIADQPATGEHDHVLGVCGLQIIWGNLAEVYALAVRADQRGQGLGARLVEACVEEARQLGIPKLMSLTYEKRFFERLGFEVVDRHSLPLKVWTQCIRCAKNQACDEIAMVRILDDVPDLAPARPPAPASTYSVPVVPRVVTERKPQPADGPRPKMDEADWKPNDWKPPR